jgi:GNAT superfamily N-acetyltransferase
MALRPARERPALERPALETDAAAIAGLSTQLGYPIRPEEALARLRVLAGRSEDAVFVAEEDGTGRVIGWIHVCVSHRLESAPLAEIGGLVVDESQRGKGTGRALVEAAAAWAGARGYATLRVRSNTVRVRTHAFYERLGFSRTKTQVVLAREL